MKRTYKFLQCRLTRMNLTNRRQWRRLRSQNT